MADHHGPPPADPGQGHSQGQVLSGGNQALYLQKIRESSEAVNSGDFRRAVQLYSEAITLDPSNHILYTNRSAAYAKLQQYKKSVDDARKAKEINPKWPKAYLREGVALQQLGQHGDALAALSSGLAQDSGNAQLLTGLVDTALKSPLKEKLGPVFHQLQKLKLNQSPFVIISVIGQELLASGHYSASVTMLEAALTIGTCSLKLRGSVFSALSSAYWGMGKIDGAITNMQHDLSVAKSLGDLDGECRAHSNLGSAYFSKGHYKESLTNHRFQLALAMKLKHRDAAAAALGSLGHVYTAIGDYPNALNSHKQCLFLMKQCHDKLAEAREIGNAGAVYLAMGEFAHAIECHNKHLEIAKSLKNSTEEARAYSNLGSAHHYRRDYEKAMSFHKHVLRIAESKTDQVLEARAYAGLGHAARCMQDYSTAKSYHEKQLDNALQTKDKVAEGRACSNLGIIYHQLEDHKSALKLHEVHLKIAKNLGDRASQGRASGNLGNAFCAMGSFEQAIKYHRQELNISSEVNDRHSEGTTHGNLAVAYQSIGSYDKALQHYTAHLSISRELKDTVSEAKALCNLGNYHSSRGNHGSAVKYFEEYLNLAQELLDSEGEAKACFSLGYAHFALGNHLEAVRYYEQDLSIARELKDQMGIARAYCNLGLAHTALKNFEDALECQKKCLTMMKSMKNTKGIFRALGNIGDITLKTGETAEAIKIYNQQLLLAKQCNSKDLLGGAYGALGAAHRVLGQFDKSLGYHTQELSIRQDMSDLRGECRAHGNIGNVHMSLGNYQNAFKCYEEQLEKSRELQDSALEAQASGNLGITKMNMGMYEDAIGQFEQQLAMLEQVNGIFSNHDKGRALGNLGDCYEALGDFEESIKCHNQYLAISQQTNNLSDQDKAYRGLGNAHRAVGNLQQALVCFEKRLVVAHELNSCTAKASAYGELGCLHSLLGNFEQAIACLQHQLTIATEMNDQMCEGEAACGLGGVYQQMGDYDKALEYHEMDLRISESSNNKACQCRAYGNLGLSHESLSNYKESIQYQEQHLSIAAEMNDSVARTLAYSSLGRVHHALNNHTEAVDYLRQGLRIAEQLGRHEDEAKIRHRLGLSLWGKGDLEECQQQLYKASDLFESIRRDSQFNSEYKMSLFDLQTACYQALQRVLVSLGQHEEALVIAERACTRAFIDYLLERQAGSEGLYRGNVDPPPITTDQIVNIVTKQKSLVLYYSIAAGYLYSWLLTPKQGIVKFHEANMADLENIDGESFSDTLSMKSVSFGSSSVLDQYVGQVRESMGIDNYSSRASLTSKGVGCDSDSEGDDVWQQHLEELGDKLNAENDRTGFLRMVNRNHKYNSSNYSLSSLFSLSVSMNGLSASFHSMNRKNSLRNKTSNNTKAPISALYQLLIEPMEEALTQATEEWGMGPVDLVLVLQGELYLIPFSVLRKDQTEEYMFERFNLSVMPSVTALQNAKKQDKQGRPVIDSSGAIVVGNPKLSPNFTQHWHLKEIPSAEYEARIVSELLTCRPLIGRDATKAAVLHQIEQVEVVHFATHLSWKLASIVLSPGDNISTSHRFPTIDSDDSSSDISNFDGPSLSEYLLTAADILNLKLHAKLVVLSSGYTDDRAGRINSDGVVGLTRALLSAGAQSVLYSLWPVPDQAAKLLMRTMYSSLQEGHQVTQALSSAIKSVQCTKQFSHPSNWGGWVLVGHDVKLSSKVALMGHAICEILQVPTACREAMRVLLHLIEKSLQRIHQGIKNSMYTTSQSIENKVGAIPGWKDLLQAVGFRFESASNGLPPAVFFPQTDPGDRLTQASASLQALLGLPPSSLAALSKFLSNYEAGEANIRVMRDILSKMAAKESNIDVQINVKLWGVPGCHEFLASLGLDLVEVGQDEVTLRLGKQANRRQLQFALQSLVAVFDTQEAPKSLSVDSSSSLESLSSSHSGSTSTSNFSKGSTPPISPRGSRKKSLFNPAEMEKMRIMNKMQLMNQGGLSGRQVYRKAKKANVSDPAMNLQHQSRVRNMYPPGSSSNMNLMADMNGIQEISENSESDVDGRDSWDNRMQVSTNSESESSTLPELRTNSESDNQIPGADQYQLTEGKETSPDLTTEEYSLSRQTSHQSETYSFDRADDVRMSAMSYTSNLSEDSALLEDQKRNSYSDSSQADDMFQRHDGTRQSDMSDTSGISDQFMPSQNMNKNLPLMSSQLDHTLMSSESGINSEVTSSNQSDTSQQSMDATSSQLDPHEVAMKVMKDLGPQKGILEGLQMQSFLASQSNTRFMRQQFQNSSQISAFTKPSTVQDQTSGDTHSTKDVHSSSTPQVRPQTAPRPNKVPPPVPSKPKVLPKSNSIANIQEDNSNQNSPTRASYYSMQSLKGISENDLSVSQQSSSMDDNDISYVVTRRTVPGNGMSDLGHKSMPDLRKSSKTGGSTGNPYSANQMSFSSFKPKAASSKRNVNNGVAGVAMRPDSATSTSSLCSTGSSVQSVIHRPYFNSVPDLNGMFQKRSGESGVNTAVEGDTNFSRRSPTGLPPPYSQAVRTAQLLRGRSPTQHNTYNSNSRSSTPTGGSRTSPDSLGSSQGSGQYHQPDSPVSLASGQYHSGFSTSTPSNPGQSIKGVPSQFEQQYNVGVNDNRYTGQYVDSKPGTLPLQPQTSSTPNSISQSSQPTGYYSSAPTTPGTPERDDVFLHASSGCNVTSIPTQGHMYQHSSSSTSSSVSQHNQYYQSGSPVASTASGGGSPFPQSASPTSSTASRNSPYQHMSTGRRTKSILNSSPASARATSKKRPHKRVSFSDSEPSDLEGNSPHPYRPIKSGPVPVKGVVKLNMSDFKMPNYRSRQHQNGGVPKGAGPHSNGYVSQGSFYPNGSVPKQGPVANGHAGQGQTSVFSRKSVNPSPNNDSVNGPIGLKDLSKSSTQGGQLPGRSFFGRDNNRPIRRTQVVQSSKC
ncbi:Tetratricopeptide repeat protein 28 [Mizuhopecten yessoensis]|uniref:Tetratricopeptide repeat protein 28 n=1 Tax=Mizuhopecten yessoensis TaxID=6573 RepID=A0A210R2N3_MIZYE|nr:Tetratricopeptide repeat protein 28 [Mizuhopecten yessoensis]